MYDFILNNNFVGNKLGFYILNIKFYLYVKYCVLIRDFFKCIFIIRFYLNGYVYLRF